MRRSLSTEKVGEEGGRDLPEHSKRISVLLWELHISVSMIFVGGVLSTG